MIKAPIFRAPKAKALFEFFAFNRGVKCPKAPPFSPYPLKAPYLYILYYNKDI